MREIWKFNTLGDAFSCILGQTLVFSQHYSITRGFNNINLYQVGS